MSPIPVPGFTGSPLDRAEPIRTDPAAVARLAGDAAALQLDLIDYTPRIDAAGMLGWSPLRPLPDQERLLLGLIDGIPRFARIAPDAVGARRSPELFAILDRLPAGEAATYATARSLLDWHARHRFCANCGAMSGVFRGGWGRRCPACGTEHYPRTDPVAIMLAEHGEGAEARVLIGRQPSFPPGRYSALAGFVEVGESVAAAVTRELFEEAGVIAVDVRFVTSQPWPFPSQLMLACIATARDTAITLDMAELEDARWVTREQVRAALAMEKNRIFDPPNRYAIANTLFQAWLAGA